MKKMIKPEIEFIKFNTQDVITTSGGTKLPNFQQPPVQDDTNKSLTYDYSSGDNDLWNF